MINQHKEILELAVSTIIDDVNNGDVTALYEFMEKVMESDLSVVTGYCDEDKLKAINKKYPQSLRELGMIFDDSISNDRQHVYTCSEDVDYGTIHNAIDSVYKDVVVKSKQCYPDGYGNTTVLIKL